MGRIQSYLSGKRLLRLLLGILLIFLFFHLVTFIRSFTSGVQYTSPIHEITHLLLRFNANRSNFVPGVVIIGRLKSPLPNFRDSSSDTKESTQSTRIDFNITPLISTGSEDLNFPLHLDFPELVRRVLANQSVPVKPINQPNFRILVSNSHKCHSSSLVFSERPDLLILIKSAPSHFALRDAIRVGWGDERCWGGRQIARQFLLGTVSPSTSQTAVRLKQEIETYGDIIQQDFVDHYYNNTYKLMFGLEWAVRYCSNAQLIMFVDDDFFVIPQNVLAYAEGISEGIRDRLISGYVWSNAVPVRTNRTQRGKWFVSKEEFPDSHYPPYVAAGNFFLSIPMARELIVASHYTRYLRFDDVFLGIILKKLVRTPIHLKQIHAFHGLTKAAPNLAQMISSHQFSDPVLQLETWDRLNCSQFCVER
ncbi:unnamed protein product [Echinostoma caproni]|uniref:Hexosyltransferase n=1 Tax=Echinostoma caproni TaxID=27848 RepID=A0A183AIK1_9TREM|nr:unnamed protein product [Echinostoma caproni]